MVKQSKKNQLLVESPAQFSTGNSNLESSAKADTISGGVIYNKKSINFKIDCMAVKLSDRNVGASRGDAMIGEYGSQRNALVNSNSDGTIQKLTTINASASSGAEDVKRNH